MLSSFSAASSFIKACVDGESVIVVRGFFVLMKCIITKEVMHKRLLCCLSGAREAAPCKVHNTRGTQFLCKDPMPPAFGLPSGTTSPIPLLRRFRSGDQIAKGKTDAVPTAQVIAQAQ